MNIDEKSEEELKLKQIAGTTKNIDINERSLETYRRVFRQRSSYRICKLSKGR
jgi:hypothetical protein